MGRPGDNEDTGAVAPQPAKNEGDGPNYEQASEEMREMAIEGTIYGPSGGTISQDNVTGAIIKMVEENGWYFAGAVKKLEHAPEDAWKIE